MLSDIKRLGAVGTLIFFAACHPRPIEELVLADVAVKAATKVKADALAPDLFRKAENFYLRAKKDFTDGYFDSCKKYATDARLMAEQAEYASLKRQSQMKDKTVEDSGSPPPPSPTPPPPAAATEGPQ